MNPILETLSCLGLGGFHRLAYVRWEGPHTGRATICLHGLTRNGRDFDALACHLEATSTVFAPDMPGRGRSDWLTPPAEYGYPAYLADVAALIARTGAAEVDIVGTSMGGLIGMMLASQPGTPVRRLVINDIGPFIPKAGLERIGSYVGRDPAFETLAELETYLRHVHASFGPLTDDEWAHLAAHGHRKLADGRFGLAYDPAIGIPFQGELKDVDLWPYYDAVRCPTLVIRGASSDMLTAETAAEMTERGPPAVVYEVAEAGHAPALMDERQIGAIVRFLEAS